MCLELLEFIIRGEIRVFIVKGDDKTDIGLIVVQMIDERPTIGIAVKRPAETMEYLAFLVLLQVKLP